jgi:hypothetical protein
MKNRIPLTILLCTYSFISFSQSQFGIFAGPQTTTAKYEVQGNNQNTEWKYGAQGGIMWKVPFEGKLYFAPAIYYTRKGYKVDLKDFASPPDENAINNDVTVQSIELAPLFNIDLGNNPGHLFIKFGPAVDFIFSGKETVGLKSGDKVTRDMKFSFGDYGRITSAAIVHLGFEAANGFIIFGHYSHGLGSMNNSDFGPSIKHRAAGLSIGKYFKKKSK